MVRETHRMGKKAVVHAVGREATLYSARAGADLSFHGFFSDDECIAAMKKSGSMLSPTLTQPKNVIEFTQPHEPAGQKGRIEATLARYTIGCANLKKAAKAGIPFLTGTDSGFAVTPYGEWHARELELFVDDLGFSKPAALRAATEVNARFMTQGDEIGVLERDRFADFIAWDGSPLADIAILQDKRRLRGVYIAGREIKIEDRPYDPRKVTDFSLANWTDLYTQERVAELRGTGRPPTRSRRVAGRVFGRGMEGIVHPKLRQTVRACGTRSAAYALCRRAPISTLIENADFVIGNVILVDVIEETPLGFHIRLHGTNLSERVRYDLTGKTLDDLPLEEFRELTRQSFTRVVTTKQPLHAQRDRILDNRRRFYERRSSCRSRSDGERVERILCALFYDHLDIEPVR